MYQISDYTKKRAKEINVEVRPSKNKNKKIDVYKEGKKIHSIGHANAKDYPTYLKEKGTEYANERRRLYHLRHTKDSIGEYLAKWLLW